MPIAINGSGTLTGISVGGLPDGIVDTDMIAADAVTAAKIGSKTFTSYALIGDVKSTGTEGGTFTNGTWQTRDLNTEISDVDDIVSISSNQFTLQAGTYFVRATALGYRVDRHLAKLRNITDSTDVQFGTSEYAGESNEGAAYSKIISRFTISGAKAFEIQHRGQVTKASNGFGIAANFTGYSELYTIVEIYKEA